MHSARAGILLGACALGLTAGGCGSPNAPAIELRKEIQQLNTSLEQEKRQNAALRAQLSTFEESFTVPTLPQERLDVIYTTAGIRFGGGLLGVGRGLTGGWDRDPESPGDEGIRLQVVPFDEAGDDIKAAGAFIIQLFDLDAEPPRIGTWEISAEEARKSWRAAGPLYHYVFELPFEQTPPSQDLQVRVAFTDALTGRRFETKRDITVALP